MQDEKTKGCFTNPEETNSKGKGFSPKGGTNRRSRRGSKKGREKDDKNPKYSGNDVAWWKKFPALMDIASRFSWRVIPGLDVRSPDGMADYLPINGMMVEYCPVIGVNKDATSPLNMVFRDLWIQMHKQYRGLGKYEQADLACAVIAIAGLYASIAEAERIYGLIHTYHVQNRSVPAQVLRACGVEQALQYSIETNLADFRYRINMLIHKARQLLLPKGMAALYNWISMNSNVYKDGDAENSQFIVFRPTHKIVYNALTSSGSCLHFDGSHDIRNMLLYTDITDQINVELEALVTDEDIAIICSDLLAFYGDKNVEYLQPMPEEFRIPIIKDSNILLKLHNAFGAQRVLGYTTSQTMVASKVKISNIYPASVVADLPTSVTAGKDFIVYQDNNNLCSEYYLTHSIENNPTYDAAQIGTRTVYVHSQDARSPAGRQNLGYQYPGYNNGVLDTWNDDPDNDEFIEASLWFTPTGRVKASGNVSAYNTLHVLTCATELITGVYLVNKDPQFVGAAVLTPCAQTYTASGGSPSIGLSPSVLADQYYGVQKGVAYLSKIDWAPLFYLNPGSTSIDTDGDCIPTVTKYIEPIGDTTNFKWTSYTDVRLVHDCAVLSGFSMDKTDLMQ